MAVGQFFDPDEGKTEFSPQMLLRSMFSQQVRSVTVLYNVLRVWLYDLVQMIDV